MKLSRKLYLPIIGFLLLVLATFGYQSINNTNPSNTTQETSIELEEVKSSEFNPQELEEYYQTYKNPFVLHIRTALNGYLKGANEGISTTNAAIKAEVDKDGLVRGLDSFSKDYYRSKFVVVSFDDFLGGGKQITIQFQDKPDKLFSAWVYELADGTYDLRGFWQNNTYTDEQLQELNKGQFKIFIEDKKHAL